MLSATSAPAHCPAAPGLPHGAGRAALAGDAVRSPLPSPAPLPRAPGLVARALRALSSEKQVRRAFSPGAGCGPPDAPRGTRPCTPRVSLPHAQTRAEARFKSGTVRGERPRGSCAGSPSSKRCEPGLPPAPSRNACPRCRRLPRHGGRWRDACAGTSGERNGVRAGMWPWAAQWPGSESGPCPPPPRQREP